MRLKFSIERLERAEPIPSARATVRTFGTVLFLNLEARDGERLLNVSLSSKPDMSGLCGRRVRQPLTGRALLTWENLFLKMWDHWRMMSGPQALAWALEFPAFRRGSVSLTPTEALEWALRMPTKSMNPRQAAAWAKRRASDEAV